MVGLSNPSGNSGLKKTRRVIVFDWDDTLMSSSWVDRARLLPISSHDSLSDEMKAKFEVLERRVAACLDKACRLGSVVIITNAEQGWVEYSAERFMPKLLPVLQQLRVVSARSTYERYFPNAPLCWKAAAFAHEANLAFSEESTPGTPQPQSDAAREIISFGDSNEERTAVRIAAAQLGATHKSVKFVDLPSLEQLSKQVEAVTGWMGWVCDHASELDLMLRATAAVQPVPVKHADDSPVINREQTNADNPWRPPPMMSLNVA